MKSYLYDFVERLYERGVRVDFEDVFLLVVLGIGSHGGGSLKAFPVGSIVHHISHNDDGGVD